MQVVRLCKIKQIIVLICGLLLASCELSGEKPGINKSRAHTNKGNIATNSKYELQIDKACGFDKSMINKKVYSFDSDREAENALKRVMSLTGLPTNFKIRAASIPNAAAVIKCDRNGNNCNRYILYNQEFMERVKDETRTNYAELAILSHEIAHHLSGHTISNTGSSYDMELEADKFAGFMLYKMGASIAETKQSFSNLPMEGSSSHPPKAARIAAVTNGWYEAKRNGETISSPQVATQKEKPTSNNESFKPTIKNSSRLKVGSSYLGGIIYEVNSSGTHGSVVQLIGTGYNYDEAMRAGRAYENWYIPDVSEYWKIYNSLYKGSTKKYFDTSTYINDGRYTVSCGGSAYWIMGTVNNSESCKPAQMFEFCINVGPKGGYCKDNEQPLLLIRKF